MISSNEQATGVNATRLFFFPLTQPVITTFCLPHTHTHTHTHLNARLITCNSLPITALSSCPVTGPGSVDKGATTPSSPHQKKKKTQREHKGAAAIMAPPGSECSWWVLELHLHIVAVGSKVRLFFLSKFWTSWKICGRGNHWFHDKRERSCLRNWVWHADGSRFLLSLTYRQTDRDHRYKLAYS